MKIFITGSPGTGKTTLSKALKDRFKIQEFVELKDFLIKKDLLEEYEEARDTNLFDIAKAKNLVQKHLEKFDEFIICGPPLPFDNLSFHLIIVLTCSKKKLLEERLSSRNYKEKKIKENIEAELLGEVLGNTLDWLASNGKIITLDSCKYTIDELIIQISNKIKIINS